MELITVKRAQRSGVFMAVGAVGFAVQLFALETLTTGAGLSHWMATAAAVELAVLHNFAWHERWTWADRAAADPSGVWRRFATFHVSSGVVSVAGNVAVTILVAHATSLPLLAANALAVAVCAIANFAAADRLVFAPEHQVEA